MYLLPTSTVSAARLTFALQSNEAVCTGIMKVCFEVVDIAKSAHSRPSDFLRARQGYI